MSSSSSDYTDAMAREHANDAPVHTPASTALPVASVEGNTAVIGDSNSDYLVKPSDKKKKITFTLVVIHEWWGLNDQIKSMADQFAASFGCAALAVDLYQEPPAMIPREARKLMKMAMTDEDKLIQHLVDACDYLEREFPNVPRGVVGWCLGGSFSLKVSLRYPMDGTIVYYGNLEAAGFDALKGPVLGIFGGQDQSISVEKVNVFEDALKEAGKEHEICIYSEANHAFANPSSKLYNREAADAAWQRVLVFVERNLMDRKEESRVS